MSPDTIKLYRQLINTSLDAYTDQLSATCPERLKSAMRYSLLLPCKRIRPVLTLLACDACGGETDDALPAACAVEMIHTFSLIHDDLPAMDNDDLRRGQPSCHKQFDEAQAILAGDALFAFAFEVILSGVTPPSTATDCAQLLAAACGPAAMAGGQSDDMTGISADIDALEHLHHRKTGALIEASLQIGAIIAFAEEEQMQALHEYGWRLGLAFQMIDDVLDCEGSAAELGKTPGKDADQHKCTYVSLLGIDETRKRAEKLIIEAKEALSVFDDKSVVLASIADQVLQRSR